ncbi:MAG: serine hydrolase [Corynebacterium sp.]|uniref:serine hydrolase n=1 Tax=Corynebacterium sp. TaxID=1720 RepID=UPI0026DC41CF|nr:serine hydrolase [Corynebacterium sp.]MDO5030213.1 serine hydrolase [Corynebacterium sp.]
MDNKRLPQTVVNSLFMVHCPSFARRGLAASLAAVVTLTATAPLANATASSPNDTNREQATDVVIAAPSSSSTSTSPSERKSSSESTTSESKSKTSEKESSTKKSEPTDKPAAKPKHFPPLVPGAKSRWGEGVQSRLDEVTEQFDAEGSTLGMGILDRQTGEFICNSHCDEAFRLASLMKVFVADVVAYSNYERPEKGNITSGTGDMPVEGNADAMTRDDMIRYSDNEATDELWDNYGGTRIVDNVRERYGLSAKTVGNAMWGATTSTPADMVAYFDRMLSEKGGLSHTETHYLRQLLYSLPRYSYGNADQNFGLRAALPKETIANKSGWYEDMHTTAGFLGDNDRFAIAVLGKNVTANDLTEAVSRVFPEGQVLPKEPKHVYTSEPLANDDEPEKANPALWALLTAVLGFGLGWILRAQRSS